MAALLWGDRGWHTGVGGLCLPWGFHTVHKSTSGMSHNQIHWVPLNWPAGPPLAHLGASCLKTLPVQFTLALQLPPIATRCLPHHSADTVTHSRHTTVTIPIAVKTQLWACWTMGASQNDEALFLGTSPWHIGERCYTLGRVLFFSQVIGLRKFTGQLGCLWSVSGTFSYWWNFSLKRKRMKGPILLWITLSPNRWQSFSLRRSHTWTNSSWHRVLTCGGRTTNNL